MTRPIVLRRRTQERDETKWDLMIFVGGEANVVDRPLVHHKCERRKEKMFSLRYAVMMMKIRQTTIDDDVIEGREDRDDGAFSRSPGPGADD